MVGAPRLQAAHDRGDALFTEAREDLWFAGHFVFCDRCFTVLEVTFGELVVGVHDAF